MIFLRFRLVFHERQDESGETDAWHPEEVGLDPRRDTMCKAQHGPGTNRGHQGQQQHIQPGIAGIHTDRTGSSVITGEKTGSDVAHREIVHHQRYTYNTAYNHGKTVTTSNLSCSALSVSTPLLNPTSCAALLPVLSCLPRLYDLAW